MISTIKPAENDDLETSEQIFQIGNLLGRNRVKGGFHGKRSKMSL